MRLSLLISLLLALTVRANQPVVGRWEGSAQIPGQELRLVVDLDQPENGRWIGSVVMPDLNVKGAALDTITVNGDQIVFTIKTALADKNSGLATFRGHLSADGKLEGDFAQGGNAAACALSKTGPPQVDRPPRSTSVTKECEGTWKGTYEMLGYPRTVTLKLQNRGSEGASAEWLIVGKRENHLPVDLIVQSNDFLTVDSHETGLSFEGRLGKDELQGTIIQGPFETPVTLHHEK